MQLYMEILVTFLICEVKYLARFSDWLQELIVLDGLSNEVNQGSGPK